MITSVFALEALDLLGRYDDGRAAVDGIDDLHRLQVTAVDQRAHGAVGC